MGVTVSVRSSTWPRDTTSPAKVIFTKQLLLRLTGFPPAMSGQKVMMRLPMILTVEKKRAKLHLSVSCPGFVLKNMLMILWKIGDFASEKKDIFMVSMPNNTFLQFQQMSMLLNRSKLTIGNIGTGLSKRFGRIRNSVWILLTNFQLSWRFAVPGNGAFRHLQEKRKCRMFRSLTIKRPQPPWRLACIIIMRQRTPFR